MDAESKQLMQEQFAKLPPELQRALQSPSLSGKVARIGEKNQLHVDQIGLLEDEVVYLMIGFTDPEEFVPRLIQELHIDQTKAEGLTKAVGEEIIVPIRESMKASDLPRNPVVTEPVSVSKPIMPTPPSAPKPAAATPSIPAPAPKALEAHPADMMLSQKTVSAAPAAPKPAAVPAPAAPAKPEPYKADPYREPIQ